MKIKVFKGPFTPANILFTASKPDLKVKVIIRLFKSDYSSVTELQTGESTNQGWVGVRKPFLFFTCQRGEISPGPLEKPLLIM